MNPISLAKTKSEHSYQTALFAWSNMAALYGFTAAEDTACYDVQGYAMAKYAGQPGEALLHWLHAIPNGGFRDKITAGKLKAEGVKAGIADVFLPVARKGYHGLYIEMKKDKGTQSKEQEAFEKHCNSNYYWYQVCYSWQEAASLIMRYLTND